MNPKLKSGLILGAASGGLAAVIAFGVCVWVSTQPAITEVSLSLACRPWWRESNWLLALQAFFAVGGPVGVLAAFRPEIKPKR